MSAITAKASRKMKKYAVLTREPRCFLGSFDFSWEQRKLGDMMNVTSVKRIHQSDWTDSGVRFLRARDIVAAAKNEEPDDYLYISKEKYEEYSTLSGKVGVSDLLVTGVGTIGVPYLVRNLEPLYFKDGNIIWFQNSDKIDGKFLFYSFSAEQIQGFINESAGIGTVGTYTIESGKKTPISLPNQIEQAKVGEFFQQLDNLITLHQRKCALLFSPFQAFISMMFTTSTFSWEQRKLGDIADIVGGGTPSTGNQSYWDGDIDWYAPAEIADQIYANSSQKKITGLGYENSSAKMLPPGTVLFTSRAGIGKTAILTRKGCTNQGFQSIVPHRGELDSYFIFSRTEELKRYGELVGAGSTFVEVSGKQMAVMELMMPPTMREQQTIGGFFQQLDHLITLHQRKCIFFTGRAGRLISTVNKKRITSSWEQRKLASLCEKFTDGDWIESKDQSDFGVRLVQTGNVGVAEYLDKPNNKKWISEDTFDRLHCEEVLPGDILISRLPEPAGRACIVPLLGTKMITAVDCTIVRTAPDMSNKFLVQYLSSQAYFDDVNTCLAGGTRQRISRGNLANFNVPIPVKKSEQDAIGMFFGYLDNLITLHQRELEKLQNIKKSMLEKMFV